MAPVAWRISDSEVAYESAVAAMDAAGRAPSPTGKRSELVWLLEHPPLYTAGTSGQSDEVVEARFPVFQAGRGGQTTYHGPGQRIAYAMLDLKRRGPDVRRYVATLEEWIIRTLAAFNVRGERREDRIGVWVRRPDKGAGHEDKIAALGIRVQRWVTLHGIAINVEPELSHFGGIVACGVKDSRYGVTSLADLGITATMHDRRRRPAAEFETAVRRDRRLYGRQAGKDLSLTAQRQQIVFGRVALLDVVDAAAERAGLAGRDHRFDGCRLSREDRFHRAVATIAHPAFDAARTAPHVRRRHGSRRPARGRARSRGWLFARRMSLRVLTTQCATIRYGSSAVARFRSSTRALASSSICSS